MNTKEQKAIDAIRESQKEAFDEINAMDGYSIKADYSIEDGTVVIKTEFKAPLYEIINDNPINYQE